MQKGVPRSGERRENRPGAASPVAGSALVRRRADGDTIRPPGTIYPRPVEHARSGRRQEGRISIPRRRLGRHHDIARPADADRARRAGGVRTRSDPRAPAKAPRHRQRNAGRYRPQLQRQRGDDFPIIDERMKYLYFRGRIAD